MKKNNYDTRLKEFLMTTFLVIIVFELISKPFFEYLFSKVACVPNLPPLNINCSLSKFFDLIPNYVYSTFSWANQNFLIIVLSLFITWFLIWIIYRFSKRLLTFKIIKRYIEWVGKNDLYTDDFWAILLLSFLIFSIIILFLYPIFWLVVLLLIVKEINDIKKKK